MGRRTKRQSDTKASNEPGDSRSRFNSADLKERLLHRPAIKAVIWGMPAPNDDLLYHTTDEGRIPRASQEMSLEQLPD